MSDLLFDTNEKVLDIIRVSFYRPEGSEILDEINSLKKPMLRGFGFFKKNSGMIWDEWEAYKRVYIKNVTLTPRERELIIITTALLKGCLPCLSDHIATLSEINGVSLRDVISVCRIVAIFTGAKKSVMKRIEDVLSKADFYLTEDGEEGDEISIVLENSLDEILENKILLALSLFKCDQEKIKQYTTMLHGKITDEDFGAIAETVMFIASAFVVPQAGIMNMTLMQLKKIS